MYNTGYYRCLHMDYLQHINGIYIHANNTGSYWNNVWNLVSLVLNFLWLFSLIKSMIGTYVYSVGFVRVENWYLPIIQLCSVVIHFCDWVTMNRDTYLCNIRGTYVCSVGLLRPEQRYLPIIEVCSVVILFCDWLKLWTWIPTYVSNFYCTRRDQQ